MRRSLLARRRSLSLAEVDDASRAVLGRLQTAVDWPSLSSVHVYCSVPAWRELDTGELIAWLRREWPQIEVAMPSLSRDQAVPAEPFDLIVAPVVGFDRDNNRLGLGGGWYDRFLARQPQATKIGIAYAWALVEEGIPVEPWDVRLDRVVTG